MSEREIWRLAKRVPNLLVSNFGRVLRLPSVKEMPHGGLRHYETRPTYGVISDGGRPITVYGGKSYRIHKLVAEAFHGPKPFPGAVVMHLDDNPKNNRADNLKWGTQKENLNTPSFLAYCRSRTGERNPAVIGRKKAA